MSGPHGWGNQGWGNQGWQPQQGYPGYPGYPPPKRQSGMPLWPFLVGGGVLIVVVLGVFTGICVWLLSDDGASVARPTPSTIPPIEQQQSSADGNSQRTIAPIEGGAQNVVVPVVDPPRLPRGARVLDLPAMPQTVGAAAAARELPAAPPQVRTIGWRVAVDPPKSAPAALVEKFDLPQGGDIVQSNWPWPHLVVRVSGTFNRRSTRLIQVWDLTTGKGLAGFPLEHFNSREGSLLAVSPDGARIAIQSQATGNEFITVASLKTGAVEKIIELKIKQPLYLRFVDAERLLAGGSGAAGSGAGGSGQFSVEIHTLADGKQVTIAHEGLLNSPAFAVSPGGKYVALPSNRNQNVLVFETASGSLAGETEFTVSNSSGRLVATAFSPDGSRLACLLTAGGTALYLTGLDVAGGASAFSHIAALDGDPIIRGGPVNVPPLQWRADGRACLLAGRHMFDCQTGALVADLTEGRLEFERVFGSDGESQRPVLRSSWLYGDTLLYQSRAPKLLVAKVISEPPTEAVASTSGRAITDATDLPLTPIDGSGARTVAAAPVSWSVPQTAPALLAAPVGLALPLEDATSLLGGSSTQPEAGRFNSVCFGKAPVSKLLLTRHVPDYHVGLRSVYLYDLSTGLPFSPFMLPRACEIAGLSDADQVLTINRANQLRVDLWSSVDGSHLRGWQPFEGAAGDRAEVAWADFTADGQVLTLSRGGELICWAADAPRALYHRKLDASGTPVMNAGKSWFVCYDRQALLVVDAQTGNNLGAIAIPGRELSACTLRGDDRMLAALLQLHDGTQQLCVCDLSTGALVFRFVVNRPIENPAWFGDHHMLLNRGAVVDLNAGLHVWTYPLSPGAYLGACGGRVWMLEQDQISACTLTDLPSGRDLVGAFAEGSQPLFGPNDEIGFSGSGEFAANAEVVVKRMGYRFNNSARRKLRVSVSSHSTGDKIYYSETSIFRPRMFGPRPGDLVMDEVELKARVELVDESGRVAWSTEYSTSMPHSIQGGQSGDLASRISQEHQKDCAGQLSRVFLPRHIVQVNAKPVALPGTSSLADELHGPADTP